MNKLVVYIFAEGERIDLDNLTSALACAKAFNACASDIDILVNGNPITYEELETWQLILEHKEQPVSDSIAHHLEQNI